MAIKMTKLKIILDFLATDFLTSLAFYGEKNVIKKLESFKYSEKKSIHSLKLYANKLF